MVLRAHGIIKGRQIELDQDTGLPAGSEVQVQIEVNPSDVRQSREDLLSLFGACTDDPTFSASVQEIERERHSGKSRTVDFDVAS